MSPDPIRTPETALMQDGPTEAELFELFGPLVPCPHCGRCIPPPPPREQRPG